MASVAFFVIDGLVAWRPIRTGESDSATVSTSLGDALGILVEQLKLSENSHESASSSHMSAQLIFCRVKRSEHIMS
jgi:hypothetical protein